jgi:hypothetical protein
MLFGRRPTRLSRVVDAGLRKRGNTYAGWHPVQAGFVTKKRVGSIAVLVTFAG